MTAYITGERATQTLEALYRDAAESHQRGRGPQGTPGPRNGPPAHNNEREFFHSMKHAYMAIGRQFGHLLYTLTRACNAKTVVEFGTSFGVSTIYLAAAIHDNGGGKIITTEYEPEKADQAKKNLAAAGLDKYVDFRVGDAMQTLPLDLPGEIDVLFLDGAKSMYIDVLKLLEPNLRRGAIITADNTDHDGMQSFLQYIREPANGYTSSAVLTNDRSRPSGHEVTIRG
jgi:predicted O-methyltransferase YrrM